MRIQELRCFSDLIVENAHQLLLLLSTSAQKVHTEVTKILQRIYAFLFATAPSRIYQATVDSSRWLAGLLKDVRYESIRSEPFASGNSSLATDMPSLEGVRLSEAFTAEDISSSHSLETACKNYMDRCKSLEHANVSLAKQVEELREQLKVARVDVFQTQQTPEQDVTMLQARNDDHLGRIHEFLENLNDRHPSKFLESVSAECGPHATMINNPREGLATAPTGKKSSPNESFRENEEDVNEVDELVNRSEPARLERQQSTQHSMDRQYSRCSLIPVSSVTATSKYEDCDYQQLTKLRSSEEQSDNWYRHALRSLNGKRKQRGYEHNLKAQSADKLGLVATTPHAAWKEAPFDDDQEFVRLLSVAKDGDDSTWYRQALQHLKNERKDRASLGDCDSLASTDPIYE